MEASTMFKGLDSVLRARKRESETMEGESRSDSILGLSQAFLLWLCFAEGSISLLPSSSHCLAAFWNSGLSPPSQAPQLFTSS